MKFPHRIKVHFLKNGSKLATIQKINHFLNHDVVGKWDRYNITKTSNDGYDKEFVGIELAFADHRDAVHFKLGFIHEPV